MPPVFQAKGRQRRWCTVDGYEMVKDLAHLPIINRCSKCHGAWREVGELERIKRGFEVEVLVPMSSGPSMQVR